jgi:hypothetical protein
MLLPPKALTGPRGFVRCTRVANDSPERDADAPRYSGPASLAVSITVRASGLGFTRT